MIRVAKNVVHFAGHGWARVLRAGDENRTVGVLPPENDNAWDDVSRYQDMRRWFADFERGAVS